MSHVPMKCHWSQGAAAVGLAVAALTAACDSSTHPGGTATVPATPTTADAWAVPAVIDTPYLQRVMDRLDQSTGDAIREMVSAKAVTPAAKAILQAVYVGTGYSMTISDYTAIATNGFQKYRTSPGNPSTRVDMIIAVHVGCIYFTAERTFAPALINPPPPSDTRAYLALKRATTPSGGAANPTGQALLLDAFTRSKQQPRDPCS
jgi:hypothetical protein